MSDKTTIQSPKPRKEQRDTTKKQKTRIMKRRASPEPLEPSFPAFIKIARSETTPNPTTSKGTAPWDSTAPLPRPPTIPTFAAPPSWNTKENFVNHQAPA